MFVAQTLLLAGAAASGSAISRFLGGSLIDALNGALRSETTGYMVMYAIAAAMFLVSALVALRLPARSH